MIYIKVYKENEIDEIVKIIKNDGIVAVPTDTVYGFCTRIDSIDAYRKLVDFKSRPFEKPFPIMCADKAQIKDIAIVDERIEKIIDNFMPGPITLVLNINKNIPSYITNNRDTIAIRMATSKVIEELIKKLGCPIFMSSANKSGEEVCKSIEELSELFPKLDGILEGEVKFGQGSTIIDCTSNNLKVLREGPISLEEILVKIKE